MLPYNSSETPLMTGAPDLQELKRYRSGTHRTLLPAETLARAQPWLQEMGITRIANVTGLDRLGIPVVMATRPNSRSVSVSQGKGYHLDAAKASAVMESVETWHAERICLPLRHASAAEMHTEGFALADLPRLPATNRARFDENTPIHWIEARNLLDDQLLWLPLEMVSTNYTLPQPPGSGYFAANTNGLASGNTLHEAICHAIYEVVERDADALWQQSPVRKQQSCGINPDSIDDEGCRCLREHFDRAGIEIKVWEITTDVGIPSFVCLAAGDETDWADPEFGAGCHPAREVALSRALTEAAQARTTYIAGTRDDIGAALYHPTQRRRRRRYCRELMARHRPERKFFDISTSDFDTIDGDLNWSLERLRRIGLREVLAVDLRQPRIGLAITKVLIPGLEGAYGHGGERYVPGERARAILNLPPGLGF